MSDQTQMRRIVDNVMQLQVSRITIDLRDGTQIVSDAPFILEAHMQDTVDESKSVRQGVYSVAREFRVTIQMKLKIGPDGNFLKFVKKLNRWERLQRWWHQKVEEARTRNTARL